MRTTVKVLSRKLEDDADHPTHIQGLGRLGQGHHILSEACVSYRMPKGETQVQVVGPRRHHDADVEGDSITKAGNSLVVMTFGHNARVGVFRIGHVGSKAFAIKTNFDTRFSVRGRLRDNLQ